MTDGSDLKAVLVRARTLAGERLAADPAWRALQQLRTLNGQSAGEPAPGAVRLAATLETELAGNAYVAVARKIDEAVALLEAAATAASSGAVPGAPAPHAVPPAGGAAGAAAGLVDDLTRIRGIRPALAADLNRLGVRNFRQIATWTAAEVHSIGTALGLDGAIHRQCWIEQAAMLDARRPKPQPIPAPDTAVQQPASAPAASGAGEAASGAAAPSPAPAHAVAPVASAQSLSALAASAAETGAVTEALTNLLASLPGAPPPSAAEINQEAREAIHRPFDEAAAPAPQPAAAEVAAAGSLAVADASAAQAPPPEASEPPGGAPGIAALADPVPHPAALSAVGPEAPAEPTASAPVAGGGSGPAEVASVAAIADAPLPDDDLEAISGVDAEMAERLRAYGLPRYADIAALTTTQVLVAEVHLMAPLRIRRQGWIEQAAMLARGALTSYAARRANGLPPLAPRPDDAPWVRAPLTQRVSAPRLPSAGAAAAAPPASAMPRPVVPQPVVPTPSITAPRAPVPLPPLHAPAPERVAVTARAELAAAVAPSPAPEALAPRAPVAPRLADLSSREARRLERSGDALQPGLAAALAAAAAAGSTLAESDTGQRSVARRSLADMVMPLARRGSSVDLRQWRRDAENEAVALAGAAASAEPIGLPALPPPETAPEDRPATDDADFDPVGEAEVLIVAHQADAAAPGGPGVASGGDGDARTPAQFIKSRLQRRAVDDDLDGGAATDTALPFEEASVEIVVPGGGAPETGRIAPTAAPPSSGLRRLVKALTGDEPKR